MAQTFRQKVQAMATKERAKLEAKKKQYWEEWQLDGIIASERKYAAVEDQLTEIDDVLEPVTVRELRALRQEVTELDGAIRQFKDRMKRLEQEERKKAQPDAGLLEQVIGIINAYLP